MATPTTAILITPQEYNSFMETIRGMDHFMETIRRMDQRIKFIEKRLNSQMTDEVLTVEEATKRLGYKNPMTVYRAIKAGKLKTVMIDGKSYGIKRSEVERYLAAK